MSRSPDGTVRRKQRVACFADWAFFLAILVLVIAAFGIGVSKVWGKVSITLDPIDIITLSFVVALGYITTVRPRLRKPELKLTAEGKPPFSPKTDGSGGGSWSLRLRVMNCGLAPAQNCIGRLIGIYDDKGTQIDKFDPITLYWQRQDGTCDAPFKPIDIQGYGDVALLDVAKVEKGDEIPIKLRVVLNLDLASYPGDYPSPGNKPDLREGTYWIYVGVHGDDVSVEPLWFEISCLKAEPQQGWESAPCYITQENPPWLRR